MNLFSESVASQHAASLCLAVTTHSEVGSEQGETVVLIRFPHYRKIYNQNHKEVSNENMTKVEKKIHELEKTFIKDK
jgi:hypothetical protein